LNCVNKPIKMLIIEDNISFQEIYEELLGEEYDLDIIGNKKQAIEKVSSRIYDIAIVDMRLVPNERVNQDGLEIAQVIRNMGYRTIIIIKSGFPIESLDVRTRLNKLDVFAVLDKSADNAKKELLDVIKGAVKEVRARSSGNIGKSEN
jgi:CheY-like chemotaxis protein